MALVHTAVHLGPGDKPAAQSSDMKSDLTGLPNVWVDLAPSAVVFPHSPEQADAIAAAFTEAARQMRGEA